MSKKWTRKTHRADSVGDELVLVRATVAEGFGGNLEDMAVVVFGGFNVGRCNQFG